MSKQYQNGDTAYITATHSTYDFSANTWTEEDPDSGFPEITIIDPDGTTQVNAIQMSKQDDGKFEYLYVLPASSEGRWRGFVDVENDAKPDRTHFSFIVKE